MSDLEGQAKTRLTSLKVPEYDAVIFIHRRPAVEEEVLQPAFLGIRYRFPVLDEPTNFHGQPSMADH